MTWPKSTATSFGQVDLVSTMGGCNGLNVSHEEVCLSLSFECEALFGDKGLLKDVIKARSLVLDCSSNSVDWWPCKDK